MWSQAIFKQSYTLELFISLKMAISCCFGLRGNLDFPDFPQKKFYNINYWLNLRKDRYQLSDAVENKVTAVELGTGVTALFDGHCPALKLNNAAILER